MADSIRIYWAVDDAFGDISAQYGTNPDGVYVNGVSLGSAFKGGPGFYEEHTGVVYNVALHGGSNYLQVYQRDFACSISGLMLSCTMYLNCEAVPVRGASWGAIKAMYR
jgi:hypothetical protein